MALLEDKQLVELHREKTESHYAVGDIYLGKLHKIMTGLNACFVSLGEGQDGFMHYLDLGSQYNSVNKYLRLAMNGDASVQTLKSWRNDAKLEKVGAISDTLKVGQYILTQVTKEPISTKGPKLSGDISLAGHFLVLSPFSNRISISQKIKSSEERTRLRKLLQQIKPDNFGVIVRTVAEGKTLAELDNDMQLLLNKWVDMSKKLRKVNCEGLILSELNATSSLLRDVLSDDFNDIYVDSETVYEDVRDYIRTVAPDKLDIVHLYKMQTPIFDQFGVQRDIRRAFGKIVTIRSGVYLYIEHTEAMHVIDVNSGNHIKAGTGQEDTALQVNKESAKEIARQLRLRDMGGIIIIDFVDMMKMEHRKELYDFMCEEMKKDKSRHTILPLSKFGLMQITRQRVRPVVEVDVQEKCPFCDGTGTIKSSLVVVDDIEDNIKYMSASMNARHLTVVTHPYIYAYLTKGIFNSPQQKWQRKYRMRIKIKPSEKINLLEYRFLNAAGEEINTI
jgi:ribonuclease G